MKEHGVALRYLNYVGKLLQSCFFYYYFKGVA